jgi:RHS repeat-associated protein
MLVDVQTDKPLHDITSDRCSVYDGRVLSGHLSLRALSPTGWVRGAPTYNGGLADHTYTQATLSHRHTTFLPQSQYEVISSSSARVLPLSYQYNDRNQVTSIKDCLDKMVRLVYDAKGNFLKAIDARGTIVVSCTYNSHGERTSMSDALGHTSHFEFDQYGNVVKERDPYEKETKHAYDILDRLTSTTNAKGKTTFFEYGVKDQIIKIIYPDRTSTHYEWYPCCQILKSVTDAKLNGTQYFYDAKRRLIKMVDAANGETSLEYDKNDNLTAIIDPKTNRSELSYDKANRLSRIDYPDGTFESFSYYPDGLLKTKTDGNGATISFEYDPVGRLVKKSYPDGTKVEFSFDAVGNRLSMSDSTGTYAYSRDDLYHLIGVTIPSGKKIGYSYNIQGQRTEMIDYDHKKYGYKYDKMNRLQTLILPGNEKIGYEFDVLSNLTKVSYPNNTYSAYSFNDMNRLIKISTMKKGFKEKFISGFDYSYDEVGNRVSMEERQLFGKSRKTTYSFDALYRLASVSYPNHLDESYSYDLAGNRTICETKKMNYVSCFAGWKWDEKACKKFIYFMFHPEYVTYRVNYSYDRGNKLLGYKEIKKVNDREHLEKAVSYEFDQNGNQVKESILNEGCRKPVENIFGYNFDNRLTSAVMKGIKQYEFSYNAAGQRIRTIVGDAEKHSIGEDRDDRGNKSRCFTHHQAGNITQHLYDGSSMIMDLDAKGKVVASYSYGMGLRAINSNSLKGFYHADALGSITEITGKEGQSIRSYRYDAWGAFTTGENSHDSNLFRYVGAYGVIWQDGTLGLLHMGHRFYNPTVGRFISKDPLNLNLYTYARNNPMKYIDPSGYQNTYTYGFSKTGTGPALPNPKPTRLEYWFYYQYIPNKAYGIDPNFPLDPRKAEGFYKTWYNDQAQKYGPGFRGCLDKYGNIYVDPKDTEEYLQLHQKIREQLSPAVTGAQAGAQAGVQPEDPPLSP